MQMLLYQSISNMIHLKAEMKYQLQEKNKLTSNSFVKKKLVG